jgi:hypothetical protein
VPVAIGLVAEGEDRRLDAVLQAEFGEDAAVPVAASRMAAMTCSAGAVLSG